jgi:hypothetical protein
MSMLDELLSSLAGTPAFPGARCRGKHHLFDPAGVDEPITVVEQRHAQAAGLCLGGCPALDRCRSWAQTLTNHELSGVIAGEVRPWSQSRKPKAANG